MSQRVKGIFEIDRSRKVKTIKAFAISFVRFSENCRFKEGIGIKLSSKIIHTDLKHSLLLF